MAILASTTEGIGRIAGDELCLLTLPFGDLGSALDSGIDATQFATMPVRKRISADRAELLPTVVSPSKIWAVGFAYHSHRSEIGITDQIDDPLVFLEAPSSVTATATPIRLPAGSPSMVDYEGELAVVIGRRASSVDESVAMSYVAGYTIANDVSARDVQKGLLPGRAASVTDAKSFDTFTPLGPYLATLDEFEDPHDLRLRTWVDGELRQDSRTSLLIHSVPKLISYLSRRSTLEAGDVILTGTPSGVGHAHGRYLRPGATIQIEIEGIGTLTNTVSD
ncbi:2-keto-4-pentenoate hydratase/2-oxohepta-3-ene-1,7-dioic acid hydratase in catechol pathway [Rhodococcus sp. LBL1]|nr:2-keto-4-pentenoate hydratase/2-oxohepta-3-ene-1,7-dioic acid hydratase in catechol pathway [Rhodococcus sp. LBL1]MDH6685137.1 2-keto-4-pentenoate hydratase/2-oxohepta-3-ene-1,7-dioic acid hydratase in catechol pathway [Rhodococcus sp. LBL2]